ncbi:hypothetical protein Cri9333_4963 (plasmid) [Crinalium epipsammum PCC 9333]|uniref:Uncharacterized protein n=2 Tax=Crinalium TaxID=241421 RepID=K9W5U4_9CYAN|nr:hypothetical protein Cri9333_4963 [Crinalium epipsammum PCC 9333]
MEWHINDLSLDGQFPDSQSFCSVLEDLLKRRNSDPTFRSQLYCSRLLHLRLVTPVANLRQAVCEKNDNDFKKLVLNWVTKSGPFWDDNRQPNQDDYFECQSRDVTDQGLGEASRRKLAGIDSGVFSFQGSSLQFTISPLLVQQGLSEDPLDVIHVDNCWNLEELVKLIQESKTYSCWQDVYVEIKPQFEGLLISDTAIDCLLPVPFSQQVRKRIFELLHVLNQLVMESDIDGQLSQTGIELLNEHFMGKKAWFTDESETNKSNFKQEMTFPDPDDKNKKIFCSWHGKIKTPQIRIHFEWPRSQGQNKIKVVYIGPKLTKG